MLGASASTRYREVAYVVTRVDSLEPAHVLLRRHQERCADASTIHFCREVPNTARPGDLPVRSLTNADAAVEESWSTRPVWLSEWLGDISADLTHRLIVRLDWPISGHAEAALLLARLSHPALRVAVEVAAEQASEIFHYMNRLGLSWIALPKSAAPPHEWRDTAAQLASLWCFDPGTSIPAEPIVSAFRLALGERLRPDESYWTCCRIVRLGESGPDDIIAWSPTLHALVTASPARTAWSPLDWVARADDEWIADLSRVRDRVDLERLARLAVPSRIVPDSEATDDA